LNPNTIRRLIRDTLNEIDYHGQITDSMIDLIQFTFYFESYCDDVYSPERQFPIKHGFMQMTRNRVEDVIRDVIRPRDKYSKNVADVVLIDPRSDSIDDMFEAAAYNIGFQILLTFYWYLSRLDDMPMGLDEVASAYMTHYRMSNTTADTHHKLIEEFIEFQES